MLTIERDSKKWQKVSFDKKIMHYPVMYKEVITYLTPATRKVIVDCTLGIASHALKILPHLKEGAIFIGIDKDGDSLEVARQRLGNFKDKVILVKDDFRNIDVVLDSLGITRADAFFFDLGVSSFQLSDPQRGFSFLREGPLDMRMDRESFLCAYDLVNNLSEKELAIIFERFGQERYSRRIAHFLVEERKKSPLSTTGQLRDTILRAIPKRYTSHRIHPATKIFQALRIVVNRELDCLKEGVEKAICRLSRGGRIVVISFHSLEDRIVKNTFKKFSASKVLNILTKKPLVPTSEELAENIRSRSAKLRAAERISL
ncbi:MAG: 16S rRNA (cytosine(1402)-N(4))-methyltransferase [Candidatus Omnitrophota bacterium]|nr:16S rRNA (cytosine(1402)-N(4))-methyltransferase RsmH [Candidatus Omnitrophota bacterium]RKY46386.1 MAG: 16S rRNA (cytosine(1402)-N(4))-methyltransferase [Candidatus Omnitrophota bacterium]